VEQEMRRIFGKDFVSFQITPQQTDDTYAFVKTKDYVSHSDALRNSAAVVSVLNSSEHPCFLTDGEVDEFIESATPLSSVREYRVGDMVKVVTGCLSGLVGMVTGPAAVKNRYKVLFKFHIRNFTERLKVQDLEYITNIFCFIRAPVTRLADRSAATAFYPREAHADERNKHRSRHRKRRKQKK
jgi:hypothetical protein